MVFRAISSWLTVVYSSVEAIAFVSRAVSARESPNYTFGPCVVQNLLLLLGPTCYAASIYMGLGRYIRELEGEQFSLLKPNWLTKVFLVGDIVSIALQAVDGGKFVKVDTADNETTVENVVIAGIMVQLVFFTLFIALATSFYYLFLNKSLVQPYGWQKFMVVISVASALILIRSLFRMIEYIEGRDGELQSKEAYVYILDAIPMATVSISFHVFHPSKYFNSRRKSPYESESEMTLGFPHIPRPGS
ncbi:RTM1 [Fusarium mexicanum]|uniref:RTM1 n=1 Tax=Fusarium mexicanum TaxID=751941 RepID=A0A8H5MPI2_9HYPO|nr:RTM1 [Fusarium mexicanum]